MQFLESYADLRPDRAGEIISQLAAPTGFLSAIGFLRPDRTRWTLELLGVVFRLAQFVEMRAKHALACRRPIEFSAQVQPIILTPGHGSLPSGHATEAFALARVLWYLMKSGGAQPYDAISHYGQQCMRLASRIAINRTVAGVHFPVDSMAGAILGLTLAEYIIARALPPDENGDDPERIYHSAKFNGDLTPAALGGLDFEWDEIYLVSNEEMRFGNAQAPYLEQFQANNEHDLASDTRSLPLEWLWTKAVAEWQ